MFSALTFKQAKDLLKKLDDTTQNGGKKKYRGSGPSPKLGENKLKILK